MQGRSKKEMKGSASDKEELLDRETGERKEEAKERKAPSPPSTTVPIYQGPRLKNPLGEADNQEEEREAEGRGRSRWKRNKRKGRSLNTHTRR